MRTKRLSGRWALIGLSAAALAACSPIVTNHGYAPTQDQLSALEPGIDTAQTVTQKVGRPSTAGVVRNDTWYYVATRFETMAYNAPEVVERRVVAIKFDETGAVEDVAEYGLEDGRVINLVTRTTPTFGRELTILRQLLGNIGNIGGTIAEGLGG